MIAPSSLRERREKKRRFAVDVVVGYANVLLCVISLLLVVLGSTIRYPLETVATYRGAMFCELVVAGLLALNALKRGGRLAWAAVVPPLVAATTAYYALVSERDLFYRYEDDEHFSGNKAALESKLAEFGSCVAENAKDWMHKCAKDDVRSVVSTAWVHKLCPYGPLLMLASVASFVWSVHVVSELKYPMGVFKRKWSAKTAESSSDEDD